MDKNPKLIVTCFIYFSKGLILKILIYLNMKTESIIKLLAKIILSFFFIRNTPILSLEFH